MALTLYCNLGQHLLLQLETFITHIVLKLAEGKGIVKIEQQEAALEVRAASTACRLCCMAFAAAWRFWPLAVAECSTSKQDVSTAVMVLACMHCKTDKP